MSLVITAWDKSVGVAVSEGRVGAWIEGKYVPTEEDHSKITRLPNGGILGIAGHSREGFPAYASLTEMVAKHLRPAIIHAAETHGFRELSETIPALLSEYNTDHPELFFCVSLLGRDSGIVRGGAWDSDGNASVPTEPNVTWHILSPSAEFGAEVGAFLRVCLEHIGLKNPAVTCDALRNIIRVMAVRHPDINDHTFSEIICASPRECMNASNISTGTLSASKVLFPDGSQLTTASRVLTSQASPSATQTLTSTYASITGFGWTLTAESAADVFTIQAMLALVPTGSGIQQVYVKVTLDGTTDYNAQVFEIASTDVSAATVPYFATLTGLSAGSHTLQFYCYYDGSGVNLLDSSYAICQRIY